jgi:hypothetical protein
MLACRIWNRHISRRVQGSLGGTHIRLACVPEEIKDRNQEPRNLRLSLSNHVSNEPKKNTPGG